MDDKTYVGRWSVFRWNPFVLTTIVVLGFGLRIWGIDFGLPHRYHIDEAPYVVAALRIAGRDLYIEYPYNSPNIFQILLALEYAILYVIGKLGGIFQSPQDVANLYKLDPTIFYLLARVTSAVIGTVTIILTYHLGQAIRDKRTGLVSAFFLAVSFLHVRDSHYAVTDILVTFLVTLCILASVLYQQAGRQRYLILAGVAAGAAIGLKYLPGLVLIAPLLTVMLQIRKSTVRKILWYLFVLLLSCLTGFFLAFPALLISPDLFILHLNQAFGQATTALGNFEVDDVPAWLYYIRTFAWGMSYPLFIAALLGMLAGFVGQRARLVVSIAVIAYYLAISLVSSYFARYGLPLVPLLAVCAAEFCVIVKQNLEERFGIRTRAQIAFVLMILLAAPTIIADLRHDYLLTQIDTRTQAKVWIEKNIPEGSHILTQWFGPSFSTGEDAEPNSSRVYEVVELTPFMTGGDSYNLDTYLAEGFQYVVINSFNTSLSHKADGENLRRANFYQNLERQATLEAEFRPDSGGEAPNFIWEQLYGPVNDLFRLERPGPIIKVYRLPLNDLSVQQK